MSEQEYVNSASFALTFLDYEKYKDIMQNDELAIDKVSGRIFYRNSEGSYFSMDMENRREQVINKFRRLHREMGNLGDYQIYTFDTPVVKLSANILETESGTETLEVINDDLEHLTLTLYLDIIRPIDEKSGINKLNDEEIKFICNVKSNDDNETEITFENGKAIMLNQYLDNINDSDRMLTLSNLMVLGEHDDSYVLGIYTVTSHDYNINTGASKPWVWDGSVTFDGSHTF